jgi:hypothetical protein
MPAALQQPAPAALGQLLLLLLLQLQQELQEQELQEQELQELQQQRALPLQPLQRCPGLLQAPASS